MAQIKYKTNADVIHYDTVNVDVPEYWESNGLRFHIDDWVDKHDAARLIGVKYTAFRLPAYKHQFSHKKFTGNGCNSGRGHKRLFHVKELWMWFQNRLVFKSNIRVAKTVDHFKCDINGSDYHKFELFNLNGEYGFKIFKNETLIDIIEKIDGEELKAMFIQFWHSMKKFEDN